FRARPAGRPDHHLVGTLGPGEVEHPADDVAPTDLRVAPAAPLQQAPLALEPRGTDLDEPTRLAHVDADRCGVACIGQLGRPPDDAVALGGAGQRGDDDAAT